MDRLLVLTRARFDSTDHVACASAGWRSFRMAPSRCFSQDVLQDVQANLLPRSTQIIPAEVIAIPVAAWLFRASIRHRDVIFFLDNQAAWSALIKSASSAEDCSSISLVCNLLLMLFCVRPWFEYVHTAQNPADPLSRDGLADRGVRAKLRNGLWKVSHTEPPWPLLTSPFPDLANNFSALGLSLSAG